MEKRIGRIPKCRSPSLALSLVTDHFDGYCTKAAEHFGVSRQAIHAWVQRGYIPPIHALKASEATGRTIIPEQFLQEYMAYLHSKSVVL